MHPLRIDVVSWARWAVSGSIVALLSACGTLGSAQMLSPDSFGMDEGDAKLYVEPAMGTEQRHDL